MPRGWLDIDSSASSDKTRSPERRDATPGDASTAVNATEALPVDGHRSQLGGQYNLSTAGQQSHNSQKAEPLEAGSTSVSELHGNPRAGQRTPERLKKDKNEIFAEMILSLLARREIEYVTANRMALQKDKERVHGFAVNTLDRSNGIERALAMVETIPSSATAGESTTGGPLPPLQLPGGRGTDAPREPFLKLGMETAGAHADASQKIKHALLIEEYALQLLSAHLPAQQRIRVNAAHEALSTDNFLSEEKMKVAPRQKKPRREVVPSQRLKNEDALNDAGQEPLRKKNRVSKPTADGIYDSSSEYSSYGSQDSSASKGSQ